MDLPFERALVVEPLARFALHAHVHLADDLRGAAAQNEYAVGQVEDVYKRQG